MREKLKTFIKELNLQKLKTKPVLVWAAAFAVCLVLILLNINSNRYFGGDLDEFEAGKVADREVIADKSISYEDEKATRQRFETLVRLVPAVFRFSDRVSEDVRDRWKSFETFFKDRPVEEYSPEAFRFAVQSEFPAYFTADIIDLLHENSERLTILRDSGTILNAILERGIYSIPQAGIERLNPDTLELIRQTGTRIEQEHVPLRNIMTQGNLDESVRAYVSSVNESSGSFSREYIPLYALLLKPFLKENVFYSSEDTIQRINETRAEVKPVMRNIEMGKRIIRKGFIITEEEMAELRILRLALPEKDLAVVFSDILFLLLLFGLLCYFSGRRVIGRDLTERETYLVAGLSALYIAGAILVRSISLEYIPPSVVVPTALIIMLPSILIHPRQALLLAMALPLGAFLTGSFTIPSYAFALVSGVTAAYALQGAEKRMDLVKAGLEIAAANLIAMMAALLWQRSPAWVYPQALFWAAFNGIASGMLVLGFLSPLEQVLNAATAFRLVELSDLNAPILRRLFTVAPGSYSHSIMVANLAEAACQDIGANPLLARVGAYYHDLGKMENPDYFVENQTDYNRHDDIAPRLSATVIRSHVKLGVEKARQLGLPSDVIDIIGEHHGNSLITWFYSKAMKLEGSDSKKGIVNAEDFSYPGNPPRSRESAVVMLADVAEAAVRTLDKPTAVKIEKFIQELIAKKVEHGQLALSELTFRDLETIKNAFVRVLAGYYHSRIEYPKETPVAEAPKK